jgi:acetyl-CoA/propionyl-CoA carboxylase biotin carboxyl carrier protein
LKFWPDTARVPDSLLIANRGEIAVRVLRACRELGIRSIAIHSDADEGALHTRLADESVRVGGAPALESYLHIERILDAARRSGAHAVHPGYGLLSENAEFASRVIGAGLLFVGPTPEVIARMGDKVAARAAAHESGIPLLPASARNIADVNAATEVANSIGYPLVIKATFGGGGRGMRVVREAKQLKAALQEAARESNAAFGRGEVYLERYIDRARHVEVQVLADMHGRVVHIGDRDCTVQRRHQKLIEEAPAPSLPGPLREVIAGSAIRLTGQVGYRSAGTVEFLVDAQTQQFYFLEMNTRLQVEHGVSELVSGIDLVRSQIHIACGEPLPFTQADIEIRGSAIQARVAAEDPWSNFQPTPGRVSRLRLPTGPWLRCDFGIESGDSISGHYDSMFGKVQAWAPTREIARKRLICALSSLDVEGIETTASYLEQVLQHADFAAVAHDTGSVERDWQPDPARRPTPATESVAEIAEPAVGTATPRIRRVRLSTSQGVLEVDVYGSARSSQRPRATTSAASGVTIPGSRPTPGEPVAPIDGAVIQVAVSVGDLVEEGDLLAVMEAMKMELAVRAPRPGRVEAVLVKVGQVASRGSLLMQLGKENNVSA